MKNNKKNKLRFNLINLKKYSISIFKSNKNIYLQFFSFYRENIIFSCSNINFCIKLYIKLNFGHNLNKFVCKFLGKYFSLILIKNFISKFVFDRSNFKYHGCIKDLSNILRNYGFNF